jgi:1-acyl-sn-glycerol-3-phosphate acyltransferase
VPSPWQFLNFFPRLFDMTLRPLLDFLGKLIWFCSRRLARFYYPEIEFTNKQSCPATGPVLVVANHQNALLDPVLMGMAVGRPIHFIAKPGLFDIPIIGRILKALGMVPAYRSSADASQTKKNFASLAVATSLLQSNKVVGMFPEGKSHDEPTLERLKSGAARLAIQAVREGTKNVIILPLGLNYQRKEQFRSAVWVRSGPGINVNQWLANNPLDDSATAKALSAEIDRSLKSLVVHLDDKSWAPLLGSLELIVPPPPASIRNPFAWLRQRKRLADAMNHFVAQDKASAAEATKQVQEGQDALKAVGLHPRSAVLRWRGWRLTLILLAEAILLNLGFVVVLLGTLFHVLPFLFVRKIGKHYHKDKSTIATARTLLSVPVYALWYGLHAWGITRYFLPWVAWAYLLPMPIAGMLALGYWRRVIRDSPSWWRGLFLACQPTKLAAVRLQHAKLCSAVQSMSSEYARVHPPEPLPVNTFSWPRIGRRVLCYGTIAVALWFGVAAIRTRMLEIPEFQLPPPHFTNESAAGTLLLVQQDERVMTNAMRSLAELGKQAVRLHDELKSGQRSYYRQEDDAAVRQTVFSYLTCRTALLTLVWKYQNHDEITDESLRWRAFLIQLGSAAAVSDASARLGVTFLTHEPSVRKLNEADPIAGIPAGTFDKIRRNLVSQHAQVYMDRALQTWKDGLQRMQALGLVESAPQAGFHAMIRRHDETRASFLAQLKASSITETFREAERMTKGMIYRGQSFVSTWVGNTRFRKPRDGQKMISDAQLEEFRTKLKPGDILVERQNWFLSRAFMPGFWAHAALYVGTVDDLKNLGLADDPRVAAHLKSYATNDADGHRHVILEAVPQGVRFTTLEHCIGVADSAAVLRPRLSKEQVSQAIAHAFEHVGKEYDFEFDFFSSDKLVCTELVHRCYDGALQMPLVTVLGRKTLPPTELARLYATERGSATAQLECICFLDGKETTGQAEFCSEEEFTKSIDRPGLILLPD